MRLRFPAAAAARINDLSQSAIGSIRGYRNA
jgi:hypothetical protein